MTRDFGGNRLRISKEQHEEILRLYAGGELRKAQLYAMSVGYRKEYGYTLRKRATYLLISRTFHTNCEHCGVLLSPWS